MTIKLTMPQAELLWQLQSQGDHGVFKSCNYSPAEMLVKDGLARWAQKYHNGTGKLVATPVGRTWGAR